MSEHQKQQQQQPATTTTETPTTIMRNITVVVHPLKEGGIKMIIFCLDEYVIWKHKNKIREKNY